MSEGRGRARGYTPAQQEQRPTDQPGARRTADAGHPSHDNGNGNGNGNGGNGGGRASHRGGAQGEAVPGDGGRQSRRVPRGRRAIQEDESTVTYTGTDDGKHAEHEKAQRVTLYANYVRFANEKMMIYQYHVEFAPEFDNRRGRSDIVRSLFPNRPIRYDGRALLFATAPLNGDEPMHFTVPHPGGAGQLEVTVTKTNQFGSTDPQTIQFLNVAFGNDMRAIGMKRIQRHHFFVGQQQARHVQGRDARLEILPGFATAYVSRDGGTLLNIDMVSKVLRAETVADTMQAVIQRTRNKDEAARAIVGQVVYAKYSNQTYRIEDVDWQQTPKSKFDKNGQQVSYQEYYKQRWNCNITQMDQPLLVAKPRRIPGQRANVNAPEKVNLVPELVYLTGLTEEMRRDFTLTREMAKHTNVSPSDRHQKVRALFQELHGATEVQSGWRRMGFQFDSDLITVKAQVLPCEELIFGSGKLVGYDPNNPDWSRGMRDAQLIAGVKLERWYVLYPQRLENETRRFVETIQRVGRSLGMDVRDPIPEAINNDMSTTYANALQRLLHGKTGPQGCQLVMCILSSNKKDSYDAIKKHCCTINPVPSQVIVGRTINDPAKVMSVATKVAIQINAKLGGEQWAANFHKLKAMIVGIDVYHDAARRSQSHVGMVSSLNHSYTRYYSQTEVLISGQEHASSMEPMMTKAINAYKAFNNELPPRIFYYRDGVSDGQLKAIVEDELAQIQRSFSNFGYDYKPSLCAVVVKKRINTRFMLRSPAGLVNPQPGTVVDTTVTKPQWCDFYLVSQSARQGTVAPTHYHVVHNSTTFSVDRIQQLSYKLTHLYYNWNGTIRVPAPCQYAHKLAFITGESLHGSAHNSLAEKLWFL